MLFTYRPNTSSTQDASDEQAGLPAYICGRGKGAWPARSANGRGRGGGLPAPSPCFWISVPQGKTHFRCIFSTGLRSGVKSGNNATNSGEFFMK